MFSFVFIEKLKNVYLTFLDFYFQYFENDGITPEAINVSSSQNIQQSLIDQNKMTAKVKKIQFGIEFEKELMNKYEKMYNTKITNSTEMIFDKVLFFNFMSFCIDVF